MVNRYVRETRDRFPLLLSDLSPPWLLQSAIKNEGIKRVSALEGLEQELTIVPAPIFFHGFISWRWHGFLFKIILKTSASPTSHSQTTTTTLPQGQILQTADGQFIILQSAEQHQNSSTQYVQVGGQSKRHRRSIILLDLDTLCCSSFTTQQHSNHSTTSNHNYSRWCSSTCR